MTTHSSAGHRPRPGRANGSPAGDVSEDTVRDLSDIFRMLADRSRLKIILALARDGAMHVTALKDLLEETQKPVSQPAVSHHLALLRGARLVRCDRQGKKCYYQLESGKLRELLDRVFSELGSGRQIACEDLVVSLKKR